MRCDVIICVTVKRGDDKGELQASYEAVQKKHGGGRASAH